MKLGKREIAIISAIIIAGVAIRIFPNVLNYAWGNDYGIYYYLSQAFLSNKALAYPPNSPWGTDGYQYFPVTFLIVVTVHYLTGVPVSIALDYSIPFLGGLTPFLIYLISRQVGFDRNISAVAGFLLVVSPIQLYQTSQPNYLTTGHFFLLLSIYFFLAYHKNHNYAIPMGISIVLLVLSHQLSTYFFLISLVGMVFAVNLLGTKWRQNLFSDLLIIELSGTLMMAYLLLRVPNMVSFFSKAAYGLGYGAVIAVFYAMVLAMYLILRNSNSIKIKDVVVKIIEKLKLQIEPKRDLLLVILSAFILVAMFVVLSLTGFVPRYISYGALVVSLPFIIFISVSVVGVKYFLIENNIAEVFGWTLAIILSLFYSFVSKNTVLIPARSLEYLSEPFCIVSAYVLVKWYQYFSSHKKGKGVRIKQVYGTTPPITAPIAINTAAGVTMVTVPRHVISTSARHVTYSVRRPVENIIVIAAVSLVLLMGVASYPMVSDFVPSHTEAITIQDNSTISYLTQIGNTNLSVATDHQIGILLYSYGFNSPFNNLSSIWNSTSWQGAINDLTGQNGTYPPVGYIFLNSYMLRYGVWGFNSSLNPNQAPIMVNGSAFTKFFKKPFDLVYENSSTEANSTSYLFEVNWTYLGNRGYNLTYYEGLYKNSTTTPSFIQLSPTSLASGLTKGYSLSLFLLSTCSPSPQRLRPY